MTSFPDTSRERSTIGVEAQLLEADRRVSEAERAAAALRRRATAAEVRVAEARERIVRERAGRDEALTELTSRLDTERRRGTALAESLQDQLADAEVLLSEAESALAEEREERTVAEEKLTAAAHARLTAALDERDGIEERLLAELEEREGDVRVLGTQLSEAGTALEELKRDRDEAAERLSAALAAHAAREEEHATLGRAFESEQRAIREAIERVEAATLAARRQGEQNRAGVEEAQRRLAGELEAERLGRETAEAALERERAEHEAALEQSERQARAELDAERSSFARERTELASRVQSAVAEAEATLAGERSGWQRERGEAAGSLSSLRTDIEATLGALHEKLEGEIERTRALTGATERQDSAELAARQVIATAKTVPLARFPKEPSAPEATPTRGNSAEPLDTRFSKPAAADPSVPPRPRGLGEAAANVAAASAPTAGRDIDDLNRRFDRIRAQLAERGIRSARVPAERRPGGPR